MISSHGLRIAEGESRENSQAADLSQKEHPVQELATGGEADRDVGAAGTVGRRRGAVGGRAALKVRWRGEGCSREAGLLG